MLETVTEEEYWECSRCKNNSVDEQWCPCPRGSCEAECVGKVITTVKIIKNGNTISRVPKDGETL